MAEQQHWIQVRINELRCDSEGQWPLRVCKEELNALPVTGNSVYLWALRPDGTVVCLDHEAFSHPHEVETDPVVIYAVLSLAARAYPELQGLVPPQPLQARRCGACGGTGASDGVDAHVACLVCRGLGWYQA